MPCKHHHVRTRTILYAHILQTAPSSAHSWCRFEKSKQSTVAVASGATRGTFDAAISRASACVHYGKKASSEALPPAPAIATASERCPFEPGDFLPRNSCNPLAIPSFPTTMASHCKASLLLMLLATVAWAAAPDDAQPAPLSPLDPSRSLLEVKISGKVSIWEGGPKVGAPLQPQRSQPAKCSPCFRAVGPCSLLRPSPLARRRRRNQSQNL